MQFPAIHRDGYPFILGAGAAALVLFLVYEPFGWLGVIATCYAVFSFRDPDRVTPTRAGLVVSPADGVVAAVAPAVPPEELGLGDDPLMRVTIAIGAFDVHVTRAPGDGVVVASVHQVGIRGPALPANGSEDNERQSTHVRLASGRDIAVVQIAGRFARRVACTALAGQDLKAGQRIGLIRFGSRVDLYLGEKLKPLVVVGQRMVGGETVVADEKSREAQRRGEVR